ncbi:hypothetical protein OF897_00695 [Chryseobacterium formosus]|uniref:Peptidase S74 domain-containing protein n=1 Tax=Chryseobacterium formosus TaxID=1537363 RepID=A0ABT3XJX6_9FLAO|nr:hypothetical protein [Chryseobacterium formosus]MCX8522440.1 hypothetical protein [Chryseobacterium formosus]
MEENEELDSDFNTDNIPISDGFWNYMENYWHHNREFPESTEASLNKKADLIDGKVPSSQLPSYVDDVLEFDSFENLPNPGEKGKIYLITNNNSQFRWSGSEYIQLNSGENVMTTNTQQGVSETKRFLTKGGNGYLNNSLFAYANDGSYPAISFHREGDNPFQILAQNDTFYFTSGTGSDRAKIEASSFIKSGGTGNNLLKDDGNTIALYSLGTTHYHKELYNGDYNDNVDAHTLLEDYKFKFVHRISAGSPNLFPAPDNANSIIALSTHPGGYGNLLGVNDNGEWFTKQKVAGSYSTNWEQFAYRSWVNTQITNTVGAYLPLTGGTIEGQIKINRTNPNVAQLHLAENGQNKWIVESGNNGVFQIAEYGIAERFKIAPNAAAPTFNNEIMWHAGIFNPNDKVNKSGDTMTGGLNVPTVNLSAGALVSSNLTGSQILAGVSNTLYIGNSGGLQNIYFETGATDLRHYRTDLGYGVIWDAHNLSNPATTTQLDSKVSKSGDTMTGMLNFTNNAGGISGVIADNDYWRVYGSNTGSNQGYLEIATGDDGDEPIHVRQYVGEFQNLLRTATLLDANGNTEFPNTTRTKKLIANYPTSTLGQNLGSGGIGNTLELRNYDAYGTNFWSNDGGSGFIQQQRFDGNPAAYALFLQPLGGQLFYGNNEVATVNQLPNMGNYVNKSGDTMAGGLVVNSPDSNGSGSLGNLPLNVKLFLANGNGIQANYGTVFWTEGTGGGYIQQQRADGQQTAYPLNLQPYGGGLFYGNNEVATVNQLPNMNNYIPTSHHVYSISSNDINNWNQAYTWGNHANAGYSSSAWVYENFFNSNPLSILGINHDANNLNKSGFYSVGYETKNTGDYTSSQDGIRALLHFETENIYSASQIQTERYNGNILSRTRTDGGWSGWIRHWGNNDFTQNNIDNWNYLVNNAATQSWIQSQNYITQDFVEEKLNELSGEITNPDYPIYIRNKFSTIIITEDYHGEPLQLEGELIPESYISIINLSKSIVDLNRFEPTIDRISEQETTEYYINKEQRLIKKGSYRSAQILI